MEYQANEILDVAVEVGINLLRCGAEIRRVEDTIKYIGKAYGATSVDVFAIPTLIIATIEVNGQTYTTKVKRNYDVTTDLFRLEKYNKLSRRICQEKPNLEEVKAEVTRIANLKDYNLFLIYLGAFISASGFSVFFGGSFKDAVAAGLVALIMMFFLRLEKIKINQFIHILLCSLIGGFFSIVTCWIGLGDNLSFVMSGAIMIVIPGLAIGTSMRDIMSNDVLSGSIRLFQAIVTSLAIAGGFGVFALIYKGDISLETNVIWPIILASSFIATLGFGIIFNNKYSHLPIVAGAGVFACSAYLFSYYAINNTFLSVMIGTVVATILSEILARLLKAPTTVFLIPSIIPFVPGARLFFMMYGLISNDNESFRYNMNELLLASLGIAVGIILASVLFQLLLKIINKFKNKTI